MTGEIIATNEPRIAGATKKQRSDEELAEAAKRWDDGTPERLRRIAELNRTLHDALQISGSRKDKNADGAPDGG